MPSQKPCGLCEKIDQVKTLSSREKIVGIETDRILSEITKRDIAGECVRACTKGRVPLEASEVEIDAKGSQVDMKLGLRHPV